MDEKIELEITAMLEQTPTFKHREQLEELIKRTVYIREITLDTCFKGSDKHSTPNLLWIQK